MLIVMSSMAPFRFSSSDGVFVYFVYLAFLTCSMLWAIAFWWCFERNTDKVFRFLYGRLFQPSRSVTQVQHRLQQGGFHRRPTSNELNMRGGGRGPDVHSK